MSKWWLIFAAFSTAIIGVGYWLLFSPAIANHSTSIALRNFYVQARIKLFGRIDCEQADYCCYLHSPIKVVQPSQDLNGQFVYSFIGRFSRGDTGSRILYFSACGGKEFGFRAETINFEDDTASFYGWQKEKGIIFKKMLFFKNGQEGEEYYVVNWSDRRNLKQILKDWEESEAGLVASQGENSAFTITLYTSGWQE